MTQDYLIKLKPMIIHMPHNGSLQEASKAFLLKISWCNASIVSLQISKPFTMEWELAFIDGEGGEGPLRECATSL